MPPHKKTSLSKDDMQNYGPVSIAIRICSHFKRNDLSNQYQSAYKKFHSTETTLLKVENDIILKKDEVSVTALNQSDLSAAFDTLDHSSNTNLLLT